MWQCRSAPRLVQALALARACQRKGLQSGLHAVRALRKPHLQHASALSRPPQPPTALRQPPAHDAWRTDEPRTVCAHHAPTTHHAPRAAHRASESSWGL